MVTNVYVGHKKSDMLTKYYDEGDFKAILEKVATPRNGEFKGSYSLDNAFIVIGNIGRLATLIVSSEEQNKAKSALEGSEENLSLEAIGQVNLNRRIKVNKNN